MNLFVINAIQNLMNTSEAHQRGKSYSVHHAGMIIFGRYFQYLACRWVATIAQILVVRQVVVTPVLHHHVPGVVRTTNR
jgi:hypothetical protein